MKGKEKFDVVEFDRKVCQITYDIHYKARDRKFETEYNKWVNQNINHLETMYDLSELECEFEDFCIWVFHNSD